MGEHPTARHASISSPAIFTRSEWSGGLPADPEGLVGRLGQRRYPVMACAGSRVVVAADPVEVVTGRAVWDALERIPLGGAGPEGWWVGLLSYDLGAAIEMLPTPRADPGGPPRAWLARYATVAEYGPGGVAVRSVDPACRGLGPLGAAPPDAPPAGGARWETSLPRDDYVRRVAAVRDNRIRSRPISIAATT